MPVIDENLDWVLDTLERSGQSEARSIAECVRDAMEDVEVTDQNAHAQAMAAEFIGWGKMLLKDLKSRAKEVKS